MINLKSISLRNIITYKEAEVKFSDPLYVIRGRNLDRKQENAANGVGKSLLLSALPTLIYSAPPSAAKKNSAKSLHEKNSLISVVLSKDKNRFCLTQEMSGRSSIKLGLNINGKEQSYREVVKAKEAIAKLFPIPEEQFYAFNYIDVMRFNPLLKGTGAQRFAFFENIVDFISYDKAFDIIAEKLKDIQSDMALLKKLEDKLEEDLKETGDVLSLEDIEKKEKIVKQLERKQLKNKNILNKITKHLQNIATFLAVADTEEIRSLPLDSSSENQINIKIKKLEEKLITVRKSRKIQEQYIQYKENLKQYNNKSKKIKRNIVTLKTELDGIEELSTDIKKAVDNYYDNLSLYKQSKKTFLRIMNEYKKIKNKARQQEPVDDKLLKKILGKAHSLKEEYKKLLKINSANGKCPSCLQPVTLEHIESEQKRVKKEFSVAKTALQKLETHKKEFDNFLLYKKLKEEAYSLRDKIIQLKKDIKIGLSNKNTLKKLQELNENKATFKLLNRPKVIKIPKSIKSSNFEKLEKNLQNELSKQLEIKRLFKALKNLPVRFNSIDEAKKENIKLKEEHDKVSNSASNINETIASYKLLIEVGKASHKNTVKLRNDIEILQNKTKHASIYSKLKEAYGARGVRIFKMEAMANRYVDNLNTLSHLLYPEKMVFSCNITSTSFGIFAERNKRSPEDVRTLSGAEARCFTALSALALATFLPPDKRFNFIIFDEIEANMDAPSRRLFSEEFLPAVQQAYSTVILLTPTNKNEFYSPHAHELIIEKKNGISRVIEG